MQERSQAEETRGRTIRLGTLTGLESGKIHKRDHYGLSRGGQAIVEGPAFNDYNYQVSRREVRAYPRR